MTAHAAILEVAALILLTLFLSQIVLSEVVKTVRGFRKMVGLKNGGYEWLRRRLRLMSDKDLIEFGKAARERYKDRQNEECWRELWLAREEWRRRHPKQHH